MLAESPITVSGLRPIETDQSLVRVLQLIHHGRLGKIISEIEPFEKQAIFLITLQSLTKCFDLCL